MKQINKLERAGPVNRGNEFVALPESFTAEQSIKLILEISLESEMVYYIYVLDKRKRLLWVLYLKN